MTTCEVGIPGIITRSKSKSTCKSLSMGSGISCCSVHIILMIISRGNAQLLGIGSKIQPTLSKHIFESRTPSAGLYKKCTLAGALLCQESIRSRGNLILEQEIPTRVFRKKKNKNKNGFFFFGRIFSRSFLLNRDLPFPISFSLFSPCLQVLPTAGH